MSTCVSDSLEGIGRDSIGITHTEAGKFLDVAHDLADDRVRLTIINPDVAIWLTPDEARALAQGLNRAAARAADDSCDCGECTP